MKGTFHPYLCGVLVWFVPAVGVDLPQQVLDALVVELVAAVTVLIQLTHLAHQEIGNLAEAEKHFDSAGKMYTYT